MIWWSINGRFMKGRVSFLINCTINAAYDEQIKNGNCQCVIFHLFQLMSSLVFLTSDSIPRVRATAMRMLNSFEFSTVLFVPHYTILLPRLLSLLTPCPIEYLKNVHVHAMEIMALLARGVGKERIMIDMHAINPVVCPIAALIHDRHKYFHALRRPLIDIVDVIGDCELVLFDCMFSSTLPSSTNVFTVHHELSDVAVLGLLMIILSIAGVLYLLVIHYLCCCPAKLPPARYLIDIEKSSNQFTVHKNDCGLGQRNCAYMYIVVMLPFLPIEPQQWILSGIALIFNVIFLAILVFRDRRIHIFYRTCLGVFTTLNILYTIMYLIVVHSSFLLALHFMFIYTQLNHEWNRFHSFLRRPISLLIVLIIDILFMTFPSLVTFLRLSPNQLVEDNKREEVLSKYGIDLATIGYIASLFRSKNPDGSLSPQWDHIGLKAQLQVQMFRSLVAQTIVPFVFCYTPSALTYTLPLLNIEASSIAPFVSFLLMLFPICEPLVLVYFLVHLRRDIQRALCCLVGRKFQENTTRASELVTQTRISNPETGGAARF
ncbi:hypothetical protein PRIPAC_74354 [Pristionchus pacificus]|uniref:G protein-coupled receptor n=1 Tax=Pristionchus pacificus TaxID=54126 RepID=A0A2A6BG57_PRIPA|nr:hypothetical protein PRIPAC_74354 [Pristionchus pacificus]|eukprot:PDM64867.1 G protein-coupled receptor [Pristionchus pacificus]